MRFPLRATATVLVSSAGILAAQQEQRVLVADDKDELRRSPLDDELAAFVEDALDRWRVPGLAVGVVDDKAPGYGISTFPSTPVTPSTLFYTGSTTKAFTAAVVSLLIASGNHTSDTTRSPLSWQTPISHLLREDFVLAPDLEWANAHLTLEDALSHRTGFPRHDKALARRYGPDHHPGTVRDVVRSLRHLPAATEPRVAWRYCNLMFMVVSHAIQTLTGGVAWNYDARAHLGAAGDEGYVFERGGGDRGGEGGGWRGFVEVPKASLDLASGAGGIVSNVLDYSRWIRCLIRGDRDGNDGGGEGENGCPVLPRAAHRELKTARIVLPLESQKGYDAPLAYALGWELGTYKGHSVFTHSGGMEAYGAEVYFFPDLEYGVVTLGNTAVTSNYAGNEVVWKLIDDKLGIPEEERYDWSASGEKTVDRQLKLRETAIEDLYPERADSPLPRALPLEKYIGVYSHPAYQNITLKLVDESDTTIVHDHRNENKDARKGELKATRDDMEWQMTFEFRHVSGEFWAVVIDFLNTPNMLNGQLARAEFEIGVKGTVDKLKVEFLEDGSEGIIVFDRIA
ncbi:hypothetical protein M426DRAFT_17969 [Hypoxylon sp. CI-4A]|nr:hypothetical protein M426DRAFT_17969 [Hypoxylon sp. CI-4A]